MTLRPHIYQHIDEEYWTALDAMVLPLTASDVAARAGWSRWWVRKNVAPRIREALHIENEGTSESWRIALTRLYYGIDRCWCQR